MGERSRDMIGEEKLKIMQPSASLENLQRIIKESVGGLVNGKPENLVTSL
jgi:hypothetical protein